MRYKLILAFLLASVVTARAQQCCMIGGVCQNWSSILGPCAQFCNCSTVPTPTPTRTPTPTPTPTPLPGSKEGSLKWLPPLMNYVESPWMMKDGASVYIGGHSGYCCQDQRPDGSRAHDTAWVIRYNDTSAKLNYLILPGATENDDHEVGGYSPLIIGNEWWIFGSRTERSYWGQGNRLRPMLVKTLDPINKPWSVRRDPPLYYPVDPACKEMGSCEGIGNSQNGSALMASDGKILVLSKDDVGTMRPTSMHAVYEIDKTTGDGKYLYTSSFGMETIGTQPFRPSFSDWATAPDGSYLAYTGDQPVTNWYKSSSVVEWKSTDKGKTFWKTGKTWKSSSAQCLWDVGVMKTREGMIAKPLTFAAIASDKCEFATVQSAWYLWIWSEDKTKLPKTFGMIPEGPPVPTYSKTGLVDENNHALTMKYKVQSDYCIFIHHDNGPWMGKESVFCGFGGTSGTEYTDRYISLRGCGVSPCPVPPHKVSVQAWGIYDVEMYNENIPRPVIP